MDDRSGAPGSRATVQWRPLPTDKGIAEGKEIGASMLNDGGDPWSPEDRGGGGVVVGGAGEEGAVSI